MTRITIETQNKEQVDKLLKVLEELKIDAFVEEDTEATHLTVALERLEAYEKNPGSAVSWEEVKKQLKELRK